MKRRGYRYIILNADGHEIGETWRYIKSPSKWGLLMPRIYWRDGEPNRVSGTADQPCASRRHAIELARAVDGKL